MSSECKVGGEVYMVQISLFSKGLSWKYIPVDTDLFALRRSASWNCKSFEIPKLKVKMHIPTNIPDIAIIDSSESTDEMPGLRSEGESESSEHDIPDLESRSESLDEESEWYV